MGDFDIRLTRRSALVAAVAPLLQPGAVLAAEQPITVHKDPA